jgi:hypothetical protein
MDLLAGKSLDAPTTISVATRFAESHGGDFSNPYDSDTQPTEYAAFPANVDYARFFLAKIRAEVKDRIGRVAADEERATTAAAIEAARAAAEDEL